MPAEFLVPLVAVAFLVVLTLFVVGLVVYLRIARRLKDRNSSGDRSSRRALWRFLWTQQDRDHSMGSLLRNDIYAHLSESRLKQALVRSGVNATS